MKKILILMGIILLSFNIIGQSLSTNVDVLDKKVDRKSNIDRINNYFSTKMVSVENDDNDIQDKKILKEFMTSQTKSQSDFNYLEGYNLSNAIYQYTEDENKYGYLIDHNCYIPQGLTIDKDNNLLLSLYYHTGVNNCHATETNSIVIRYNPDLEKILNVYKLDTDTHAGGIAYYHKIYPFWGGTIDTELIFVSESKGIANGVSLYSLFGPVIIYRKNFSLSHPPSTLSTTEPNNPENSWYLWSAEYIGWDDYYPNTPPPRMMTGYKIIDKGMWDVSIGLDDTTVFPKPNYELVQPKLDIQGVYCDSDPNEEKRLKFYFTASNNITYVYQAVLVTKDINNDGKIFGSNEYYWESFYTPYGYGSGSTLKLPDGGEGIVIRDNKLLMLNEGATEFYCNEWYDDLEDIDCAREILVINPIQNKKIFPSGTIEFLGDGIENFGRKLIFVIAQNKLGEFYFSNGLLNNCQSGSDYDTCKTYLYEPTTAFPKGKQYSYASLPRVYAEDIKGIIFFNLDDSGHIGNSDDFYLYSIKVIYDKIYGINGGNYYSDAVSVFKYFGDDNNSSSSGDKEGFFSAFDFRYNDFEGAPIKYINHYYNEDYYQELYYIFEDMDNCFNDSTKTAGECMDLGLNSMNAYFQNNGYWWGQFKPMDYLNTPERFNDIVYTY
jgi:hypothetical protein